MSDQDRTWQEEFKEAVANYVIERGIVTTSPDDERDHYSQYYGGPYDFEAHRHIREGGCEVATWSDIQEDEWNQFDGTFDDGDGRHYGISIAFSCKCGKLKDRRLLTEDRFGDVLRSLVGFDPVEL